MITDLIQFRTWNILLVKQDYAVALSFHYGLCSPVKINKVELNLYCITEFKPYIKRALKFLIYLNTVLTCWLG